MKHSIYVASSWRNPYHLDIVGLLIQQGHEVYNFRNPVPRNLGFSWASIDPYFKSWSIEEYKQALQHPKVVEGFEYDRVALVECDIVVLLLPSGRSSHIEAAWHKGRGGIVIVHSPEQCEPELMNKLFNAMSSTDEELISLLNTSLSELTALSL